MSSLAERVAEIRAQQRSVEKKEPEIQEMVRAANLDAFNKFEQGLSLKKNLEALAEAEQLRSPVLREIIAEPDAREVELRLEWQRKQKSEVRDGIPVEGPKGFFSISIKWSVGANVKVSGEEIEAVYTPFIEEEYREDFEDSVAQAYLNPQWKTKQPGYFLGSRKFARDMEWAIPGLSE